MGRAPTEQLRTQIDRVIKVLEDPEMAKEARMVERRTVIRRVATTSSTSARPRVARSVPTGTPARRRNARRSRGSTPISSSARTSGKIEMYSGEKIQFLGDTIDGIRPPCARGSSSSRARTSRWTTACTASRATAAHLRRLDRGREPGANYRAQFNKIIQTSGYASLVKKLAAKEQEGMQADRELTIKKASQIK